MDFGNDQEDEMAQSVPKETSLIHDKKLHKAESEIVHSEH